jgi:hypothetical protein
MQSAKPSDNLQDCQIPPTFTRLNGHEPTGMATVSELHAGRPIDIGLLMELANGRRCRVLSASSQSSRTGRAARGHLALADGTVLLWCRATRMRADPPIKVPDGLGAVALSQTLHFGNSCAALVGRRKLTICAS